MTLANTKYGSLHQGTEIWHTHTRGTNLLPHIKHIVLTVVSFAKVAVSMVVISAAVSVQLNTASNVHDTLKRVVRLQPLS